MGSRGLELDQDVSLHQQIDDDVVTEQPAQKQRLCRSKPRKQVLPPEEIRPAKPEGGGCLQRAREKNGLEEKTIPAI